MTTTDPRSARTSRGTPGGRTPPAGAGASRPWPAPAAASSACLLPTAGAAPGRQRRPRRRRPSTARRRGAAAPWRSHHLCMHGSVHTIQEGKRRKAPVRSREQDARRERNQQMLHGRPLYSHLWPSRADALLPNGGNRKHTGMGGSETDSPGRGPGSGTALATRAAASQSTGQLARDRCCLSPLARSARNAGTAYFISDTITI